MNLVRAHWRRLVLIVTAAVAVVTLGVWALPYAGVPLSSGPIDRTSSYATAIDTYEVGDRFTYGLDVVGFVGVDSAVITDVEVMGPGGGGVEILGARLGGPDRRIGAWQIVKAWPPRHPKFDIRPLDTPITSEADGRDWELFIGLEVTGPGDFLSEGWRITYEANGRTYRHTIPARVLICPRNEDGSERTCPVPDLT